MKKIITTLTATICLFLSKNISAQGSFTWTTSGNTVSVSGTGTCGTGPNPAVKVFFQTLEGTVVATADVTSAPISGANPVFSLPSIPIPASIQCNGYVSRVYWSCTGGGKTDITSSSSNTIIRPFNFTNTFPTDTVCSGVPFNFPFATNVSSNSQWSPTPTSGVSGANGYVYNGNVIGGSFLPLTNNLSYTQSVVYNISATTTAYAGYSCNITETKTIVVHPKNPALPTVSVHQGNPKLVLCKGDTMQLKYNLPNAGYNYPVTWSTGATSNQATDLLTVSQVGSYSVSAPHSCEGIKTSNSINITSFEVNASAVNTSLMCGQTTTLSASISGATNATYSWSPNNGSLTGGNTATPTVKPTSTTSYIVSSFASPSVGCISKDTITITVYPAYSVTTSATNTSITCGDSVQLQASVIGNEPNIMYWSSPSDSPLTGANTATPIAKPTYTTSYIFTVYTQGGNCYVKDTITITVNPYQVNASATKTEIACGGSTKLQATETNGATYSWSPNNTLTGANTVNPTAKPTSTTTYTVSSSLSGCGTATDNITITVGAYTPQIFTHTTNELTATFTNKEENAVSYAWDFGDGNASTSENPTHTYDADGTYNVCLTLTNACDETETVCANVTVNKGVGVNEILDTEFVEVYPNPAHTILNIVTKENTTIKIIDILGKTVTTQNLNAGTNSIDVSSFMQGVYFVQSSNGGAVKFIKE